MSSKKPALSLSDFAFKSRVRIQPGKDWSPQLLGQLKGELQVKGSLDGTRGYCNAPEREGTFDAGLNVLKVAKGKLAGMPVHKLQVSYAAFGEEGLPVSWSGDHDEDYPTKTEIWFSTSSGRKCVLLSDDQRKRAKALAPPGAKKAKTGAKAKAGAKSKAKAKTPSAPKHDAQVEALSFTPDGSTIVSSGADGRLRLWRAGDGAEIRCHRLGDRLGQFAIEPAGGRVVAAASKLTMFDLSTGDKLGTLRGHGMDDADSLVFLPDDRIVSTSMKDIVSWNAATGERLARVKLPEHQRFLAASPDGAQVALAFHNRLEIRNVADLSVSQQLEAPNERFGYVVVWCDAGIWLRRETIEETTVGMDDGRQVPAVRYLGTRLDLLDPQTLEPQDSHEIDARTVDPNGRLALTATDQSVTLVPLVAGRDPIEVTLPEEGELYACSIGPDGKRIAVGQGPRIHLLDVP